MKQKYDHKIIYKKPDQLIAYANNSRTHSDFQIGQIKKSITEFGFTTPVLINDQYAYPLHKITAIPLFYGKSSKNPYYSPLFDFIVGKALDLRKATSSLCLNH